MKFILILLLPFLVSNSNIFKKKETPPPGTVKVRDNFFVDQSEVRNADYLEFLFWMKRRHGWHSTEYKSALPDTNMMIIFKPHKYLYLRDKEYRQFPVVGVSYDQATAFCKWRSDMVNANIYAEKKKLTFKALDTLDMKLVARIYEYRLPTKAEWEEIAAIDYTPKIKKKIEKENLINGNFFDPKRIKRTDVKTLTHQVAMFHPNSLGIYDLFGNVEELTSEKGIAKGGSWQTDQKDCTIQKDFNYDMQSNHLGFRCVCVKLINETN